jgi:LacI family transcriptional regulator
MRAGNDPAGYGEDARPTLKDIAREAQVSTKTVSLALRSDQSVSGPTAARIREIAYRLGYVGRGQKRQVIAVIVPYIGHQVYADLFGFLRREANSTGFTALLAESTGQPTVEKSLIDEFRWRGVDGIVMVAPRMAAADVDRESRLRQPIVTVGMQPPTDPGLEFARIEIDHAAGGRLATQLLIDNGHRRIAYLAGRAPSASDQGRRAGYRAALAAAGIPFDEKLVVEAARNGVQPWPDYDVGREQCAELLRRRVDLDAILAYSDAIAIGAMRALHEQSDLRVPADLSMIGLDGLALAQFTSPRLTSVGVRWYDVALAALDGLVDLMAGVAPFGGRRVQAFTPEIVPGESVARRMDPVPLPRPRR